jgi:hypothetical protein
MTDAPNPRLERQANAKWTWSTRRHHAKALKAVEPLKAAGLRVMYDAVTWQNIPGNAQMAAGYVNGIYAWPQSAWDTMRARNTETVGISVFAGANAGQVLDCETSDATPAQCPGWVVMRRNAGTQPAVYMNTSTWGAVRNAFAAARVPEPTYWVAAYPGIGPSVYAGAVAHQYADPGPVDISVVLPVWPGIDGPTPPPPPPKFHPSGGQEDNSKVAIATRPAPGDRAIDAAVVGADGNVYGTWASTPSGLATAAWGNLGMPYEPYGVYAKTVSLAWTQDGGQLVLTAHGSDNFMWTKVFDHVYGWLNNGAWQKTGAALAA